MWPDQIDPTFCMRGNEMHALTSAFAGQRDLLT